MFEYCVYVLEIMIHFYLTILLLKQIKRDKRLLLLAVFNISIIGWIISISLIMLNNSSYMTVWFARSSFILTTIAAISLTSFLRWVFLNKYDILSKIYLIVGIFVIGLSLTENIALGVDITTGLKYPPVIWGDFSWVYSLFIVLGVLLMIVSLFVGKRRAEGIKILQATYITTGLSLGGIVALFTNLIIPLITGDSATAFWGPIAISAVSILTSYSFGNIRLFSMKFLIGNIMYFLTLLLSNIIVIILALFLSDRYLNGIWSLKSMVNILFFVSIQIALTIKLSSKLKEVFVNQLAITSSNYSDLKEKFYNQISKELDLNKLGISTISTISKIYDLERIGIVIFNKDSSEVVYRNLMNFNEEYFALRDLLQTIYYWDNLEHSNILIKQELSMSSEKDSRLERVMKFMDFNKIEVILPLNRKVQLNGVILLGAKKSRSPFTKEDISLLQQLLINSSIAFGRALLYQEVQSFNKTLQSKVDNQTQELQVKVLELQEARKKERDMIDIMGHELRTPATIIKLNAELLEKYVNSNPDEYKKYLGRIRGSIENEIKLINTLLTSAKLEGNRIEINKEVVDIAEEIEMVLHGYEGMAKEKGLKIFSDIPSNVSMIYADKVRTIEILDNLVGNGLKYTKEGSVTVKVENDGEFVKISVVDTGGGIPSKEIPMLGSKFHRVGNYTGGEDDVDIVRPGGTGLGLFVAFGLVNLMGGKIFVESELGKGSKFIFTLPSYKGQKINNSSIGGDNDMFSRLGLKR